MANWQRFLHGNVIKWMKARAARKQRESEPMVHCTAYDSKRSLRQRHDKKCTFYAMKTKRNGLRIMLTEKPLWQESELRMQRQRLGRSSKIRGKLKTRDWQPECLKKCFRSCWMISGTVWVLLQVPMMRMMRKRRMMERQSWASWAKMTNPAAWWAQSPKRYSSTWRGFGWSRSGLMNWHNRDGWTHPTTLVKATRCTVCSNSGFRQSLNRKRMILPQNLHPQHFERVWRLLISTLEYPISCEGLPDQEVVISGQVRRSRSRSNW